MFVVAAIIKIWNYKKHYISPKHKIQNKWKISLVL